MTSKRMVLTGFAVAVVGGLIALFIAVRVGGSDSEKAAKSARTGESPEERGAEPAGRTGPSKRPALEEADAGASDDGPRVYVRDDGKVVRDHRSGNPDPMLTGGIAVPKKLRKIEPRVIYSVRKAIRPLVYACAEDVDPENMGEKPEVQGEVLISIVDGAVTVDRVEAKLRDVEDDDLVDCVRAAVADVSLAAEGHPDVSRYWLTFPFRLRR